MKRFLLIVALAGILTGCGFEPLHGKRFQESLNVNLNEVAIDTDRSRLGQLLKAEIQDQVNPAHAPGPKKYALKITFTESELSLFINPDGTSSSGDLVYSSHYVLTRLSDGVVIDSGALQRQSSYNTSDNADYASFVSEEDARKRALLELAQDYKLRLANLLPKLNDPNAGPVPIVQPQTNPETILPSLRNYEDRRPGS